MTSGSGFCCFCLPRLGGFSAGAGSAMAFLARRSSLRFSSRVSLAPSFTHWGSSERSSFSVEAGGPSTATRLVDMARRKVREVKAESALRGVRATANSLGMRSAKELRAQSLSLSSSLDAQKAD